MVYIDRYGRVLEQRPWDVARVIQIFTGLWFFILQFFKTLLSPFQSNGNQNRRREPGSRSGSGGGGGGGGGGGFGRGSGSGGSSGAGMRPNRRIGRIQNSMDCNIPGGG